VCCDWTNCGRISDHWGHEPSPARVVKDASVFEPRCRDGGISAPSFLPRIHIKLHAASPHPVIGCQRFQVVVEKHKHAYIEGQTVAQPVWTTRKPSWRKGKHATAVRVLRPLANKSTANQRYAISYWWLIVTMAALLTVCEIFSRVEVENSHFCTLYSDCRLLAEERPAIWTYSMHHWKVHLVGYNSVADSTGLSSFVSLPNLRNHIAAQGHPRSSILVLNESA